MLNLERYSDTTAAVGRLLMSALFVIYGYFKLTAFSGTAAYMAKQGLPAPTLAAALAVLFEFGGGLLLLVGYQTRLVALILAVYVLIATLIAHTHLADGNQLSHFWKNIAIVGGFLMLVSRGGGRYSLDARGM